MDQITVSAIVDQVETVTDFVNERLRALGCSQRVKVQLDVAIDEIFSNIVQYAYEAETGPATVRFDVEGDPPCVVITFIDRGIPFDPLAEERPDVSHLPMAKRPIGGLGLFMVKKTMDDISYVHKDGQNMLTLRKRI